MVRRRASVYLTQRILDNPFHTGATFHREQHYAGTTNKMVLDLAFDAYHRLGSLDYKLNGSSSTHLEQYVWDADSNLLKRKYTKQDGSAGDAYDYDKYDRLTGAKLGVSSGQIDSDYSQITSSAKEIAYALDPGNNRSSVTVTFSGQTPAVTSYNTESTSPRYSTITGISPPPLYDGEGNMIWDGTNYMVYDFRNRLTEVYQTTEGASASSSSSSSASSSSSSRELFLPVSKEDLQRARDQIVEKSENGDLWKLLKEDPQDARASLTLSSGGKKKGGPRAGFQRDGQLVLVALYIYDTHNRRVGRQVALSELTVDQRFAYDGWREVEELVPQSGQAVAEKVFVWGRELDELLGYQRKESGGWVSYYPVQDRRESVVKLLDAQGNIVENVEYDPYGKATVFVSGSPQGTSSVDNPYLYQGRRLDPETGFVYLRNRYLHTKFGRFLSIDPLGSWSDPGNLGNGYAFVGNWPTVAVDVLGLQTGTTSPPEPPKPPGPTPGGGAGGPPQPQPQPEPQPPEPPAPAQEPQTSGSNTHRPGHFDRDHTPTKSEEKVNQGKMEPEELKTMKKESVKKQNDKATREKRQEIKGSKEQKQSERNKKCRRFPRIRLPRVPWYQRIPIMIIPTFFFEVPRDDWRKIEVA